MNKERTRLTKQVNKFGVNNIMNCEDEGQVSIRQYEFPLLLILDITVTRLIGNLNLGTRYRFFKDLFTNYFLHNFNNDSRVQKISNFSIVEVLIPFKLLILYKSNVEYKYLFVPNLSSIHEGTKYVIVDVDCMTYEIHSTLLLCPFF